MKREELLKLPKGRYLVTDNICNYKYVLVMYEKEKDNKKTSGTRKKYIQNIVHGGLQLLGSHRGDEKRK